MNPELILETPPEKQRRWTTLARLALPPSLIAGLAILIPVIVIAVFPQIMTRANPTDQNVDVTLQPPSADHLFGTDNYGRDVFTRVIYGTGLDLQIGIFCVIFPFCFGTLMGALAGYRGGFLDTLVMRAIDVVVAFPFLVLIIGIVAVLGPGLTNMYIAVSVVGWIVYARIVRSEVLVTKNMEFVEAARVLGFSKKRILFRHILPNVVSPAIIFSMSDIVLCILVGTSLSFLGLGAQPPTPEWGAMISEARGFLSQAPWIAAFPGLAVLIVGIGFSLVGDGLADLLRVNQR